MVTVVHFAEAVPHPVCGETGFFGRRDLLSRIVRQALYAPPALTRKDRSGRGWV